MRPALGWTHVLSAALAAALTSSQPHWQDGSYFLHVRAVSFLWAFADDFFVRIRCEPGLHQSTIEMQVRPSTPL